MSARPLGRRFYARDARELAPLLLNKVLVRVGPPAERMSARIVEVEAYAGSEDAGSHAFRGPTRRNQTMFGPPGHLYVYFTYGMHWCANVVASTDGVATAVLLRAGAPLTGLEQMRARRPRPATTATSAPVPPASRRPSGSPATPTATTWSAGPSGSSTTAPHHRPGPAGRLRVGLGEGRGDEHRWRWFVRDDPNVSRSVATHRARRPRRALGHALSRGTGRARHPTGC